MKYPNGEDYVEVKDKRYLNHPIENLILRKWDPPPSPRIQYRVENETQMRKNQKVIKNEYNELIVKNYPKIKPLIIQKQKFKPPNCPTCKQNNWLEFHKSYCCRNCEYIINKQKHQIDKKVLRQDYYFSTRLRYADKNIREKWINMPDTTYNRTEDMINKLQQLKSKTK